jgi:hypothetical protein
MTQFEQAVADVKSGKVQPPSVSMGKNPIDYFGYQLSVHKFNLSIMASGMTFRNVKLSDLKRYYGLKGRSAKDCLPQFLEVITKYEETLK